MLSAKSSCLKHQCIKRLAVALTRAQALGGKAVGSGKKMIYGG